MENMTKSSPIKESLSDSWAFFKQNMTLSFIAMAIMLVLFLLSIVPIVGIVFNLLFGIVIISMQVYVGKSIIDSGSKEEFFEKVKTTQIGEFLGKYLSIGVGAWLGYFVISMVLVILSVVLMAMLGGLGSLQDAMSGSDEATGGGIVIAALIIFLFSAIFAYIYPLVFGKVLSSNNLSEAFKSVFLLLSPSIWKKSFNGEYFLLVLFWSLIGFAGILLTIFFMFTLILSPIAVFIIYLLTIFTASVCMHARMSLLESPEHEQN